MSSGVSRFESVNSEHMCSALSDQDEHRHHISDERIFEFESRMYRSYECGIFEISLRFTGACVEFFGIGPNFTGSMSVEFLKLS